MRLKSLTGAESELNMYMNKAHCDNCGRRTHYLERVCTVEGNKDICWGCRLAYNILDRLPNAKERNMNVDALWKRRKQDEKNKAKKS